MTDENDFALCLCVSVGTRGTVSNVYGKSDHTTVISLPEMLQSAASARAIARGQSGTCSRLAASLHTGGLRIFHAIKRHGTSPT